MKDLTAKSNAYKANQIIKRLILDIRGRRGLGNSWEGIDQAVQKEIKTKWRSIIIEELKRNT